MVEGADDPLPAGDDSFEAFNDAGATIYGESGDDKISAAGCKLASQRAAPGRR